MVVILTMLFVIYLIANLVGVFWGKETSIRSNIEVDTQYSNLSHEKDLKSNTVLREKTVPNVNQEQLEKIRGVWLNKIENLMTLTPQQFEIAIGKMFMELGYNVQLTPQSNDKGIDLFIQKNGENYAAECKRYNIKNKVGRADIQKFHSALIDQNISEGFYVTTSRFTKSAIDYTRDKSINLIDRDILMMYMARAYPNTETVFELDCPQCNSKVSFGIFEEEVICTNGHIVSNIYTRKILLKYLTIPKRYYTKSLKRLYIPLQRS